MTEFNLRVRNPRIPRNMMDQQLQLNKNQSSFIPESLKKELREFHLAVKAILFYPKGHPALKKTTEVLFESFQRILSEHSNHSITAIGNTIYINNDTETDKSGYPISDEMSADLAQKFRQKSIRSVIFAKGLELWELEKLLEGISMNPKNLEKRDLIKNASVNEILQSANVLHIRIKEMTYDNVMFEEDSNIDTTKDEERILTLYLLKKSEILTDDAFNYLSSLLNNPELMARLISMNYNGVGEPDGDGLMHLLKNLFILEDRFAEKEEFQKKVVESVLLTKQPVKNILFSVSDLSKRLADGLSIDEIAKFVALESKSDYENSVPLREMIRKFGKQVAGVEEAVKSRLMEIRKEYRFDNRVFPIIEQIFAELVIEKRESESSSAESYLPDKKQASENTVEEAMRIFKEEDESISMALVLTEMLEYETNLDNYSRISEQLAELARFLIIEPGYNIDKKGQSLNAFLQIINIFSQHSNSKEKIHLMLQDRAREAIDKITTEDIIDQSILYSMELDKLESQLFKNYISQLGDKGIQSLIRNLLNTNNSAEYQKLKQTLISMGHKVLGEVREWIPKCHYVTLIKNIIPIIEEFGRIEVCNCFREILNHPDPMARSYALDSLAKLEDQKKMDMNQSNAGQEPPHEEESSIQSDMFIQWTSLKDEIIGEIEKILRDKDPKLKKDAISTLGSFGGQKSESILSDILKQKRLISGRRELTELQLQAIEALSKIGTPSAIKILSEMSGKKRGDIKYALKKALQSHNTKNAEGS